MIEGQIRDAIVDKMIDAVLPGPTPNMAQPFKQLIMNAKDVTKEAAKVTRDLSSAQEKEKPKKKNNRL